MTIITDLADEVRILELEAQKLELENRIACMKAEQSIDDECIGCAGPCKVVDVAAKLQKELDSTIGQLVDSRKRCDHLSTEIESREAELFDLKNAVPDNFWAVVTEKDSMIKRQGKVIEDFKTIETKETDRLHKIIEELKDRNIEDLKELYDLYGKELGRLKHVISARDLTIKSLTVMCQSSGSIRNDLTSTIEDQKRTIDHFINCIGGIEAELSIRKEDSEVLMKVVEIVKRDDNCPTIINQLADLLVDYLDALEGPPETPIDDLYKVTVTCAFLEMP